MHTYRLIEDGQHYDSIEAPDAETALELALITQWVVVRVVNADDDYDRASATVELKRLSLHPHLRGEK